MKKQASEVEIGDTLKSEDGFPFIVEGVRDVSRMSGSGFIEFTVNQSPGYAVVHRDEVLHLFEQNDHDG